ncbi:PREDICTED: protein FAR1-RELATED SEQUENCE 5-like [Camelina sativa]|uniref:Protein FAR1-RELATED SEQUENCE 5-like n=1 Tax=Camelina sativa TaxID=90675 RepID=A0ABM0T0G9_CAMSA|nr:PREDICTED: protein FAR1-RELATED SEQUENCE 5-like [Camelina sativa]
MESQLSGHEIVLDGRESSLQVSGDFGLLSQNSIDFLATNDEFEEECDIANKEDYVQTEEVATLEAKEKNEKKDEICIGMEFSSDEAAYIAYKNYGGNHGFDVRKQRREKKKDKVVRLVYVCSKQGYRKELEVEKSYSHPVTRCGCNAHMACYLQENEKYKIVSFEPNHNHNLVRTPMKHLLKVNREISDSQKQHAHDADMSGISAKQTVEMMSREVGGRGNLDDRSISDYNLFGDVVCFVTTYKTNEYDRPFAPFVGVNHHKKTVVFGAALLYDETTESYKWLFETFLGAMSRKQPKTIFTDQSAAMANAIVKVFPGTKHRLCVWHIYQNAAKKLSHVFHGPGQFAIDFGKCVYDHEEEEDWLLAWSNMLKKHNLTENKWLKNVFEVREKWAMVYGRHSFTADMVITQRSESMNNILKRYLKSSYDLLSFFEHYERVLDDRRYNELTTDFKMMHTSSVLSATVEMLQHAEEVYTPEIFRLFQKQYIVIGDYVAKKDSSLTLDTQLSVATTSPTLYNTSFASQVLQDKQEDRNTDEENKV